MIVAFVASYYWIPAQKSKHIKTFLYSSCLTREENLSSFSVFNCLIDPIFINPFKKISSRSPHIALIQPQPLRTTLSKIDGWQPILKEDIIEIKKIHGENLPKFDHPYNISMEITRALPDFDKNRTTAVAYVIGLVISWLPAPVCLICSISILRDPPANCFYQAKFPPYGQR